MRRFARRFTAGLLGRPHLIAPHAAAAVVHFLLPNAQLDFYDDDPSGAPAPSGRDYQVVDSVAVVPVLGELVHRGGGMDALSGLTSYQALQDMSAEALADPSITGLLLDIDSPGGESAGALEFAAWLADQRGTKPIFASINSMACSAAYAIASAADRIFTTATGVAGSIGVVAIHTDVSQALSDAGLKLTVVQAGSKKTQFYSMKPLSDGAQADLQHQVDLIYQQFVALVARNRGLTQDQVAGTEAGVLLGQDAIRAGLADGISTMEEALMSIHPRQAPAGARLSGTPDPEIPPETPPAVEPEPSSAPPTPPTLPDPAAPHPNGDMPVEEHEKTRMPVPPASPIPATPQAIANACTAAGCTEIVAELLGRVPAPTMEAVTARIATVQGIREDGAKAGAPHNLIAAAVRSGMAREAAREMFFDARAAHDQTTVVNTGHPMTRSLTPHAVIEPTAIYSRYNAR